MCIWRSRRGAIPTSRGTRPSLSRSRSFRSPTEGWFFSAARRLRKIFRRWDADTIFVSNDREHLIAATACWMSRGGVSGSLDSCWKEARAWIPPDIGAHGSRRPGTCSPARRIAERRRFPRKRPGAAWPRSASISTTIRWTRRNPPSVEEPLSDQAEGSPARLHSLCLRPHRPRSSGDRNSHAVDVGAAASRICG